ncbi:MAG: T6SS immunity protein Tdi1 domain-containing protein [Planctomycetota bacterium]
MQMDDYLLDHAEVDWSSVLAPWHWLLPASLTIWIVNRFGDIFAVLDDGCVYMFDVGRGTIERVAESREHFGDLLDTDDNASDWLMIPLVDDLVAGDKTLKPGECYGYALNPVLGGDYTTGNTIVLPLGEHYRFNAEIHRQIKDLPDGAEVTIEFTDD